MSENGVSQRQEIPTHLEVEDRILFGLTLRQGVVLLLGTTVGYFLFAQSGQPIADVHIPLALRIGLGLIPVLVALAVALVQPAGRPLEDWLFAIGRYLTVPKQCVWRPRPSLVAPAGTGAVVESLSAPYVSEVASGDTSREQRVVQDETEAVRVGSYVAKR